MRDISLYLQDIIVAMLAIEQFVEGISFDEFKTDDKTSSAVIRKFEIIGEAAKQIPEEIRNKYTLIPWKEMAGMRDRLIHFYFGIKYELVWHTIKDVIPQVKPAIQEILKSLKSN
ncbi:MAG: DUF86 domain-containing protein [Nitrospirae bacterium]|jgi:uncharacterized protein with HEPN domain|nr:DUF86 domain-containing protein [Nitrospirota bacterium]